MLGMNFQLKIKTNFFETAGCPERITETLNLVDNINNFLHVSRPDGKIDGEVIDPYVKVRIRGHPDDHHDDNEFETEHIRNNGFNPVWKNAKCTFKVTVTELAFLEFKVKDHSNSGKDHHVGSFACPFTMLREGKK